MRVVNESPQLPQSPPTVWASAVVKSPNVTDGRSARPAEYGGQPTSVLSVNGIMAVSNSFNRGAST
jgi:hypothetical protein